MRIHVSLQEINKTLKLWQKNEGSKLNEIQEAFSEMYNDWKRYLTHGFHLSFYGLGSKTKLIDSFAQAALSDRLCVFVKGNDLHISLSAILDTIIDHIIDYDIGSDSMKKVYFLNEYFSNPKERLYLILTDLDELAKNHIKIFNTIMDDLCAPPANIHLITTVNYTYAPILIKNSMNFVWIETNTYELYDIQSEQKDPHLQISKEKECDAALAILESTSSKAIQILCTYIHMVFRLSSHKIPIQTLYDISTKLFIVNSRKAFHEITDVLLEAQLLKRPNSFAYSTPLHDETLRTCLKTHRDLWKSFDLNVFDTMDLL